MNLMALFLRDTPCHQPPCLQERINQICNITYLIFLCAYTYTERDNIPEDIPMPHSFRNFSDRYIPPGWKRIFCIMAAAFIAGSGAGKLVRIISEEAAASAVLYASPDSSGWGLSYQEEGRPPVGNAGVSELRQYNAFYVDDTEEMILYLTFDAGYENGNTARILDALKKHNAPATFFVVGNFIEDEPELIKRMVSEGHTVGNHTMTHPDMSSISTQEDFRRELEGVEQLYEEITGESMTKFYRPPRGIYSAANLSMAKELGYCTFFWSLAYVDWIQDQQPTREEAFEKLLGRVHPGAIVLLHNTSSTNGEILDELLTEWENMGYHFAPLQKLAGA